MTTQTSLTGIEVSWTDDACGIFEDRRGMLTCEHAASSYGLPVVVGDDGPAYGPGDFETSGRGGPWQYTGEGARTNLSGAELESLLTAARAAGWKV